MVPIKIPTVYRLIDKQIHFQQEPDCKLFPSFCMILTCLYIHANLYLICYSHVWAIVMHLRFLFKPRVLTVIKINEDVCSCLWNPPVKQQMCNLYIYLVHPKRRRSRGHEGQLPPHFWKSGWSGAKLCSFHPFAILTPMTQNYW